MSLQRVFFDPEAVDLPRHIEVLLDETAEAINSWQSEPGPYPFVPADYVMLWDGLFALRRRIPRREVRFLEWGSGMGIATLMAWALGFQADGIEIQSELVRESRKLARQFDLPARFHEGSFFPRDPRPAEDLERLCARADVIYVYPWPDYELQTFDLFDRVAKPDACLLAYFGLEDLRLFVKERAGAADRG